MEIALAGMTLPTVLQAVYKLVICNVKYYILQLETAAIRQLADRYCP